MEQLNLIDKDIEELYFDLGKNLDDEKNALPKSFKRLADLGYQWVEDNLSQLQDEICKSKTVLELSKETDKSKLFVAIADIIASLYVQIPVFTVSAIVLKIGINKFCSFEEPNTEGVK